MGLFDFVDPNDRQMMGLSLLSNMFGNMGNPNGQQQNPFSLLSDYKKTRRQDSLLSMQMDEQRRKMEDQQREKAIQEQFMNALPGLLQGQPQHAGYRLNTEADATNTRIDPAAQNDVLSQANRLAGKEKMGGKLTEDEKWLLSQVRGRMQEVQQQGQPDAQRLAQLGMIGQLAGVKGAQGVYNYAKDFSKPDWQQIDSGGQIGFVNKNSGQMPTIQKTMSPDAVAANQLGWANNNISQQNVDIARFNATKPTYHDGALISPTGEVKKTPMYSPPKGTPEAQAQASAKLIPLLDLADTLLPEATGSYFGSGRDAALGAVGVSTKGAQAAAQLKAIEGAIMMAQPRMEGPQSDKDVALYRQMAAQVGDSTIPVETRRAAVSGIRALQQKYMSSVQQSPQSTMSGGGVKFLGFE